MSETQTPCSTCADCKVVFSLLVQLGGAENSEQADKSLRHWCLLLHKDMVGRLTKLGYCFLSFTTFLLVSQM